jgi:hypothetical protein
MTRSTLSLTRAPPLAAGGQRKPAEARHGEAEGQARGQRPRLTACSTSGTQQLPWSHTALPPRPDARFVRPFRASPTTNGPPHFLLLVRKRTQRMAHRRAPGEAPSSASGSDDSDDDLKPPSSRAGEAAPPPRPDTQTSGWGATVLQEDLHSGRRRPGGEARPLTRLAIPVVPFR